MKLTGSRSTRHTLSSSTVDGASILLQGLVGNAACTISCLTSLKAIAEDSGSGRDSKEAEKSGGDGELHFEIGGWCFVV